MFDQEILASQVKADRFPFPCERDVTLAVCNKDYALGPVMLHLTPRKVVQLRNARIEQG